MWTRLLSMLLLGTVYVFSIILAVFLVGLALGSGAGSWLIKRVRPQLALGWCQILLLFGFAWTAYMIVDVLPFWKDDALLTPDPWHMYYLDLKRCILAILPPTLFWGASFPLACAAVAKRGEDSGRTAGAIYAANTLGGIVGALAVSLVLIPWIGSQQSERVLIIAVRDRRSHRSGADAAPLRRGPRGLGRVRSASRVCWPGASIRCPAN